MDYTVITVQLMNIHKYGSDLFYRRDVEVEGELVSTFVQTSRFWQVDERYALLTSMSTKHFPLRPL